MRRALLLLSLALSACAPTIQQYQEPPWGDAPLPRPDEVTEITVDHLKCTADKCKRALVTLRRDGRAYRQELVGGTLESYSAGTIDSTTFVELAKALIGSDFFRRGQHDERDIGIISEQWVLSAATFCRRKAAEAPPTLAGVDWAKVMEERDWRRVSRDGDGDQF